MTSFHTNCSKLTDFKSCHFMRVHLIFSLALLQQVSIPEPTKNANSTKHSAAASRRNTKSNVSSKCETNKSTVARRIVTPRGKIHLRNCKAPTQSVPVQQSVHPGQVLGILNRAGGVKNSSCGGVVFRCEHSRSRSDCPQLSVCVQCLRSAFEHKGLYPVVAGGAAAPEMSRVSVWTEQ